VRTLTIRERKQTIQEAKKKSVLFIIPVISNGTEEHTSNGMVNTTAITFDSGQGRLIGILLVQPLCDAADQL
jgi:hypothetical protein